MSELDKLLDRFEDGRRRFLHDPVFNETVNHIVSRVNKIEIIGGLLDVIQSQRESINKLSENRVNQIVVQCSDPQKCVIAKKE